MRAGSAEVASITSSITARAAKHDAAGEFPKEDFQDIRDAGLLGLMVPATLGGLGATFQDYVEVAMTLASANGATALVYNMHTSVTGAFARTPDELARTLGAPDSYFEARDQALRSAASGALFAVAMSERGAGSRLSSISTQFTPNGDGGYHIKGAKTFVSGAGCADSYLVAAKSAGTDEVSLFLVPTGPGLTVDPTWDSMGMRATGSHDLYIDADVGPDALIGGIEGLAIPLAQIMPQWLVASYAAVYAGVAQSAIVAAKEHIRARDLTSLPSVRARVGRAEAEVAALKLVVRETAQRIDAAPGEPETNAWIYRAKLMAGDTALSVASSMLEAAGTSATRRGNALERIYRDARCGALQPATSDVCADWLGAYILGDDPNSSGSPRW